MCGRFTLRTPAAELARQFMLPLDVLPPRFNVAPSQAILAMRLTAEDFHRQWCELRWGLVPHWAQTESGVPAPINARSETAAGKPAFRQSLESRRCLIPADGFYEWKTSGKRKAPFHVRLPDQSPFAFAGLWDCWRGAAGQIESCTILTTAANPTLRPLHERMPVIVAPADYDAWLTAGALPAEKMADIFRSSPCAALELHAVSNYVNSPRHDDPQCLAAAVVERTLFDL